MSEYEVAVMFGGRSVEHEVSVRSARTVTGALAEAGYRVAPVGVSPDGCWLDRPTSLAALAGELDRFPVIGRPPASTIGHLVEAPADVVFPLVHGTWGEDGTVQGLCELLDVPYVGASVTASAVCMDKVLFKRVLGAAGLPVLEFAAVDRREMEASPAAALAAARELPLPVFVKPSAGGSSVGVGRVTEQGELDAAVRHALRFDDRVLVERGVVGRELEVAVLGLDELEASAVGEIVPGREFYDYQDKYLTDDAELIAPASLDAALEARLRRLAVEAFAVVGGGGMARVDFLLDGDEPFVNEINTVPGFTAISMYPRLWGISGLPLPELVDRLVRLAVERHAARHRLDAGIRDWLAELDARE